MSIAIIGLIWILTSLFTVALKIFFRKYVIFSVSTPVDETHPDEPGIIHS